MLRNVGELTYQVSSSPIQQSVTSAPMEPEEAAAVCPGSAEGVGGQLKDMLRQVERQVEALVRDTRRVQAERDNLLGTLLILQSDENIQTLEESEWRGAVFCPCFQSQCARNLA